MKNMPGGPKPEKLLPTHISPLSEKQEEIHKRIITPEHSKVEQEQAHRGGVLSRLKPRKKESPKEGPKETDTNLRRKSHEARWEELDKAPDFDGVLREYLKEKGIEPPETLNLSLIAIEEFQRYVKESQDLRKVLQGANIGEGKVSHSDPKELEKMQRERKTAAIAFARNHKEIKEYLSYGASFERAYREYIRARNSYVHFMALLDETTRLENLLNEPAFATMSDGVKLDAKSYSRLEGIAREVDEKIEQEVMGDTDSLLESLKTIYPEGSEEYEEFKREILEKKGEKDMPRTKKEIIEALQRMREEISELWDNNMVHYFWQKNTMEKLLKDFAEGQDVLEQQSTIEHLNILHEWETQHQRSTIGAVLVGPPGVGKTTTIIIIWN